MAEIAEGHIQHIEISSNTGVFISHVPDCLSACLPACLPTCLLACLGPAFLPSYLPACLLDLSSFIRKFVLSSPRRKMGSGDVCRVPPVAVRHGRARQSSGTGPSEDCRRICGYRSRGVSIRVLVLLLPLPHWKWVAGGNGPRRRMPSASSSGTPRESQAKFRDRTVWGL